MKEEEFKEKIQEKFEEWVAIYGDLPNCTDDIEFAEFEGAFFNQFLNLDIFLVDNLLQEKTNIDLTSFFAEHYNQESIIDFILFIIHFVIEERVDIFITHFECNGNHCGHWATALIKESEVSDIINERIIELLNSNLKYSEHYKKLFVETQNITNDISNNSIKHKEKEKKKDNNLLKLLVGGTATVVLSGLLKYSISSIKLWVDKNNDCQTMFALGTVFGSIKIYGFCLEKHKPSPQKESMYETTHINELNDTVHSAAIRTEYFVQYFLEFIKVQSSLLSNISKKEPDKIWLHLQLYFWLITQPFSEYDNKDNEWEDFFITRKNKKDLIVLNQISTKIINKIQNAIHSDNTSIFNDIIEHCNEKE
jgi:predicted nucleic-acid-binding Zn-ribbon protein